MLSGELLGIFGSNFNLRDTRMCRGNIASLLAWVSSNVLRPHGQVAF